jgi:hypothetical protein
LEHLTTIIKYFAMADPSVGPCFSKPKTIVVHGHFDATIAFGMEGRWSNSRGEYANQRRDTTKGNRLLSIYDFKKKKEFKSPSQYRAGLVTLKIYGKVDGWEKGYSHELADKNELLHDFFKVYEREGTIYLNDRLLLWKGRTVLAGHLILPKPIVTILKVGTAISKFMRGKGNEQND